MSISITHQNSQEFNLTAGDIEDGKAYISEGGALVIGNRITSQLETLVAFSVDGHTIVVSDSPTKFREVDIDIIIKN